MTNKEKFVFLDNIKLENGFFPIDEENCREKNAALIENMEKIFDLKDGSDYTYLFALAELMADPDKVEAIKRYLLEERSYPESEVKAPDWETKLLVSTALEDNPLFFSMAWNWASFIEYQVKKNQAKPTYTIISISPEWSHLALNAAGSGGPQDMGVKIPLQDFGILGFEYDVENSEIQPYFVASESAKDKKITITVEFTVGNENYSAVIRKLESYGTDKVYAEPIFIEEKGGIEIVSIKVEL